MTLQWMLGVIACGALVGIAALAAEPVAAWFRLPRRWIWAAAMAGAVLLPLAAGAAPGLLPRVRVPAGPAIAPPEAPAAALPAGDPGAPAQAFTLPVRFPEPRPLPAIVLIGWMAASLATLGTLAWARRRVRRACEPFTAQRVAGVRVRVSERAGPMVLGVLDPVIVLPRWALEHPETCRIIVRHEREHVAAGDPRLLALAVLAVAALPWSPALWWMHRRLRLAVETDCDARVLDAGESRRRYVDVLLDTARRPAFAAAGSLGWSGRGSLLERRLRAITASRPRLRAVRALPLAAIACAGAAAACHVASDTATRSSGQVAAWSPRAAAVQELPDTTLVFRVDSTGRLWTEFEMNTRYGQRQEMHMSGPVRGAGRLGLRVWFPNYPNRRGRGHSPPGVKAPELPVVRSVDRGSPVEAAGMRPGDVLLAVDGVDSREPYLFSQPRPGRVITFRVSRGGIERDVRVTVAPALSNPQAEHAMRLFAGCVRKAAARAANAAELLELENACSVNYPVH